MKWYVCWITFGDANLVHIQQMMSHEPTIATSTYTKSSIQAKYVAILLT